MPAKKKKRAAPAKPDPLETRMIKPQQLAERMGFSRRTIDRMEDDGEIGPLRLNPRGRMVAYDRDEIEAWLGTPTTEGKLHTRATWPAIWERLKAGRTAPPPGQVAPGSRPRHQKPVNNDRP